MLQNTYIFVCRSGITVVVVVVASKVNVPSVAARTFFIQTDTGGSLFHFTYQRSSLTTAHEWMAYAQTQTQTQIQTQALYLCQFPIPWTWSSSWRRGRTHCCRRRRRRRTAANQTVDHVWRRLPVNVRQAKS